MKRTFCNVKCTHILKTAPDGKFDLPNPKQLWQKRVIERGSWDSAAVHDPEIIPRWGKYWLYYKRKIQNLKSIIDNHTLHH